MTSAAPCRFGRPRRENMPVEGMSATCNPRSIWLRALRGPAFGGNRWVGLASDFRLIVVGAATDRVGPALAGPGINSRKQNRPEKPAPQDNACRQVILAISSRTRRGHPDNLPDHSAPLVGRSARHAGSPRHKRRYTAPRAQFQTDRLRTARPVRCQQRRERVAIVYGRASWSFRLNRKHSREPKPRCRALGRRQRDANDGTGGSQVETSRAARPRYCEALANGERPGGCDGNRRCTGSGRDEPLVRPTPAE